jgi:hypothetical protein
MEIRFYLDPETGQPLLSGPFIWTLKQSRMRLGQTEAGRFLQIIYAPDRTPGSVFVITAYELKGKAKKAHRRRQRRKGR